MESAYRTGLLKWVEKRGSRVRSSGDENMHEVEELVFLASDFDWHIASDRGGQSLRGSITEMSMVLCSAESVWARTQPL